MNGEGSRGLASPPGYPSYGGPTCSDLRLQVEPCGFDAGELPGEIALALERGDQSLPVALDVGVGRSEPAFQLLLLGRQRLHLGLDVRELPLQRLAQVRKPLALGSFRAPSCPAMRRRIRRRTIAALRVDERPSRSHPVAIVVEIAVERRDAAVGDQPQLVGGRAQQVAVVRDDDQRAVEVLQRLGQRLAHLDVEVIGRLVEQQQVRPLPHEQRRA